MPYDQFAAVDEDFLFPPEVLDALTEHLGITALNARLDALESPGVIVVWPKGDSIPAGYLLCDGTAVSRETYAALFAVIGTSEGVGDGSTTFNLPNLKGKTIVGQDPADGDFDTVGDSFGSKTHALTAAENGTHNHGNTAGHSADHSHGISHDHDGITSAIRQLNADSPLRTSASTGAPLDDTMGYVTTSVVNLSVDTNPFGGSSGGASNDHVHATSNSGSSTPHNNVQPSSIRRWIIKT